mmetsp:Transcript_13347/g.40468  ORF Transcript_13347/g.40468 Transcript_13347/m.40468 type:complete len:81 (+) Transcript_13347:184-426(+)|eukprot:scaffold196328_cov33-Tisochrysis_lutea.AAC.3
MSDTDETFSEPLRFVICRWGDAWGEGGYIRLTRSNDERLYADTRPDEGVACRPYPSVQKVGGESGVLFDASIPIGVRAAL